MICVNIITQNEYINRYIFENMFFFTSSWWWKWCGEREPKLKLNLSETFHFYFPASIVFPAIQLKMNLSETFLVLLYPSPSYKEFWINIKTEIDETPCSKWFLLPVISKNLISESIVRLFPVVLNCFEDCDVYFTDLPSSWMFLGLFKVGGTAWVLLSEEVFYSLRYICQELCWWARKFCQIC